MGNKQTEVVMSVSHLDHEKLAELEGKGEDFLTEDQLMAVEQWASLRGQENKKGSALAKMRKTLPSEKSKAAIYLMDLGFYNTVAEVKTSSVRDALEMTSSIKNEWYLNKSNKINVLVDRKTRDTQFGDILTLLDDQYLVMPLGFIDLSENTWVEF